MTTNKWSNNIRVEMSLVSSEEGDRSSTKLVNQVKNHYGMESAKVQTSSQQGASDYKCEKWLQQSELNQ